MATTRLPFFAADCRVHLLTSERIIEKYGVALHNISARHRVSTQLICVHDATDQLNAIDAAFFSRDLYEGSSLRLPGERSNAFFQAADNAPNLKWLHVCSSGLDLPQYAHLLEKGIRVSSSRGAVAKPIAQTAAAAILALSRGFGHWLQNQSKKQWSPLTGASRPKDIAEQEVLIVGTGAIGSELARILAAIGFQVTGARRTPSAQAHFDAVVGLDRLDHEMARCDWLVLALPLDERSRGLISRNRIAQLSPHARIANISRGELIDEPAMVRALQERRIAGAYLDVFQHEPLPASSPLWDLENVWISPHNCAASSGQEHAVAVQFMHEYDQWLQHHFCSDPAPANSA